MALEKFSVWREMTDTTDASTAPASNLTKAQETGVGKLARMSMSNLRNLDDMEDFLLEVLKVVMEKTGKDASAVGRVLLKLRTAVKAMGQNI